MANNNGSFNFDPRTPEDRAANLSVLTNSPVAVKAKEALAMVKPFRDPGAAPMRNGAANPSLPPSLSSPPPMLAQPPAANPAIARMQSNAGATGLGASSPTSTSSAASALAAPPQRFKSTLPGGINYEGDMQGNRTYTMGTPGQDGYGKMTVHPGTAQPGQPVGGQEQQQQPQQPQQQRNAPPDALNGGSRAAMLEQMAAQQRLAAAPQAPKYMTKEEGIQAGIGWKGRLSKYAQDVDTYNKATGNQTALDVEGMREAGAGARAQLAAQGVNDRNAIDRESQQSAKAIENKQMEEQQRLNESRLKTEQLGQQKGQMELDTAKRMESVQQAYINEQDPIKKQELGRQWQTLNLKSGDKYQMTTRKSVDPATGVVTETPYAFDPNSKETIEIGGGAGMAKYEEAPLEVGGRKKGTVYNTPKGPLKWTGSGWDDQF